MSCTLDQVSTNHHFCNSTQHFIINEYTEIIEDYTSESDHSPRIADEHEDSHSDDSKKPLIGSWISEMLSQLSQWLHLQQQQRHHVYNQKNNNNNNNSTITPAEIANLWEDWEWVLSRTEEIVIQQAKHDAHHIQQELEALRQGANSLKFRPWFATFAREAISSIRDEKAAADLKQVLDSSKSSKIIADVVNQYKDHWLECIYQLFFLPSIIITTPNNNNDDNDHTGESLSLSSSSSTIVSSSIAEDDSIVTSSSSSSPNSILLSSSSASNVSSTSSSLIMDDSDHHHHNNNEHDLAWKRFKDNYYEQPYQKNVVGSLKELAFSASLGPKHVGIDEHVLTDILWSLWKTLAEVIRNAIDRQLTQYELSSLASAVAASKDDIVRLWIRTVQTSRHGTEHAGRVVQRWKEESHQASLQLKQRIATHGVDAKWDLHPYSFHGDNDDNDHDSNDHDHDKDIHQSLSHRRPLDASVVVPDIQQLKRILEEKLIFSKYV